MNKPYNIHSELFIAKTLVYDKCSLVFDDLITEDESKAYSACTFRLNGMKIKFRISKITPTKPGQFVTIWKRNKEGVTQPFDLADEIDFVIIFSRKGDDCGQFIFPKPVLLDKGIMTQNNKQGKRGIRVYPPWDKVTNKQAQNTQVWQTKYFFTIRNDEKTDLSSIKEMFGTISKRN